MKKFLKIIGGVILALVALYVISCFFGPKHFFIEQKITIQSPTDSIYKHVADYSKWDAWSPWTDESMSSDFIGLPGTVGHKWQWKSENQGNGAQTILSIDADKNIQMQLDFEGMDPSYTHWKFMSTSGGVEVTWGMDGGDVPFIQRGMMLLFQGMIESDYEKGLNKLKSVCEKN